MASKKKKVVTKDDLRRLMKETQSVTKSGSKKIDHPLAKYNSLNQLVCTLCNTSLKSDLLWNAHLQSKSHKEKYDDLKSRQAGVKRKAPDIQDYIGQKKSKGNSNGTSLPSDFFDSGKKPDKAPANSKPIKSILTNSNKPLLSGYGSDSEEEDETPAPSTTKPLQSDVSGIPADFFDAGVMPSASTSKVEEEVKPTAMADVLPEGFFDDPKQDAKVRKVEYVDKMEEEWELFQKTMKEEAHVSEAIIEEEEEQVNVDRNIDEIDEQIQCWKEVNDLETKKEEIMKNGPVETNKNNDSDDELNEEMLEEFLDWRSKKLSR